MNKGNKVTRNKRVKFFRYGGLAVQVTKVYEATDTRPEVVKIDVVQRLGNKVIAAAGNHFPRAAKCLARLPKKYRKQLAAQERLFADKAERDRLAEMGIETPKLEVAPAYTDFRKLAKAGA